MLNCIPSVRGVHNASYPHAPQWYDHSLRYSPSCWKLTMKLYLFTWPSHSYGHTPVTLKFFTNLFPTAMDTGSNNKVSCVDYALLFSLQISSLITP